MLPDLTPDQKLVYLQYEVLKKEFSALLTTKNELLSHDEAFLTALYLAAVGKLQHQKFCLQVEIKMLTQRIQLTQAYINKNEYPDKEQIQQKIELQFTAYQEKIRMEAERLAAAKKFLTESTLLPPHVVQKIKDVFRLIVKRLHPDLNPTITDREMDLFIKAQAAYDMSDLDTLNAILLSLDIENASTQFSATTLKDMVTDLESKTSHLRTEIEKIEQSFPFLYREKLSDKEWIETQQIELDQDIKLLEKEKIKYSEYLLLMDEWKPVLLK